MICRSADPIRDAWKYDDEAYEREKKCPICCSCGDRITDETYLETVYKGKILRFHDDCIFSQYTSEYIEEREEFQ